MHPRKPLAPFVVVWAMLAPLLVSDEGLAAPKPRRPQPRFDPGNFVSTVDHPYLPLTPGRKWRYEDRAHDGSLLIAVTMRAKLVMGVRTIAVVETIRERGRIVETSENWIAQDRDGNVWQFGE